MCMCITQYQIHKKEKQNNPWDAGKQNMLYKI